MKSYRQRREIGWKGKFKYEELQQEKKMIALEITTNDDVKLRKISEILKLNNPHYNQSAVLRRCITETFEKISADSK